jgi:MFS family permease
MRSVEPMTEASQQPAYRWVIVFAAALILALSMGAMVNGMSAFIVPMQESYGWARGDAALINFAGIMGMAFGGVLAGRVADRIGARPVLIFGVVVLGLCYLLASLLTSLWQYYALFAVAGFFGAGAIFPPVMALVGNWFAAGAGLAIGIVSAGQALGQGGVPFASSFLIDAYGVQGAFGVTGAVMLAVMAPAALLMRRAPSHDGGALGGALDADETAIPYNVVIVRMSAAVILCCTCMSVPLMHLVPLVQDVGFPAEEASSVIFSMMLAAILGRVAFGRLSDMIGAVPAYMTATAWMTAMVFGFVWLESLSVFYVYAIVYGFGYAGVMTGLLTSVRALTPVERRASAMGVIGMFAWFGHAIGGYQGGLLYDLTGAYDAPYAIAAAAGVVNLVIVSTLLRRTRRPELAVA